MQSILIADAHTLCREALCDYIRYADKGYETDSVGDYSTLLHMLEARKPDLVLIDTDLPGWSREEVAGLQAKYPQSLKIGLIIPIQHSESAWDTKINGVFPKSLSCKAFLQGIGLVLEGKNFFPSLRDNQVAMEQLAGYRKGPQDFNLTTREKEVLGHLVKGASNKDIARALDLQVVTVKLHVRGICRKMKASNRTQAALFAKEHGWG